MDGGIWNMESKNQENREVLMGPFFWMLRRSGEAEWMVGHEVKLFYP